MAWALALHALWAVVVGASVTAQLCCTVVLNGRSRSPTYHAFYVSSASILLGGILLLPLCVQSPGEIRRPKYWWSTLGGACALTSFFAIPAGMAVGVQLVLLVQLVAMLATALAFDFRNGRVARSDWWRFVGFSIVLSGTAIDELGADPSCESGSARSGGALLLAGVFTGGVGYAFQAKFNRRLACDLGSTARATAFSAAVATSASAPVAAVLYFKLGVQPVVEQEDWPLWMFVGLQSAFYIGSLAMLPKKLGYTASYLALLAGKIGSSSAADAAGLAGRRVPFGPARGASLALVLAGAALFTAQRAPAAAASQDAADERDRPAELGPSFDARGSLQESRPADSPGLPLRAAEPQGSFSAAVNT